MNEHIHEHGESCGCGAHGHEHGHHEDDHAFPGHSCEGSCGQTAQEKPGVVYVETHLHDEACVISGRLKLNGDYGGIKAALNMRLKKLAEDITSRGGIVGHIKASCDIKTVDMYSVTDIETEVSVKRAPDQEIKVIFAAIVFLVAPADAERLVKETLNGVVNAAGT